MPFIDEYLYTALVRHEGVNLYTFLYAQAVGSMKVFAHSRKEIQDRVVIIYLENGENMEKVAWCKVSNILLVLASRH